MFQQKQGRKATYLNSQLKTFRSFIKYCKEEEYTSLDVSKLRWAKEEKLVIETFTPKQVKTMLEYYKNTDYNSTKNRTILMILFETGIRCYELCCIKVDDIKTGYIVINGKHHKQRIVPLTPILEKQLMRYLRIRDLYFDCKKHEKDYLFLSRTGRQLTNSAIEYIVKAAGVEFNNVRVSPHTCRHFYAQQQLRNGLDVYSLSRLLGHNNIAITQRYLNGLDDNDIVVQARALSVIQSI